MVSAGSAVSTQTQYLARYRRRVTMVNAAGWRVERVAAQQDPGAAPGPVLRVSWRGYWQADCLTTAEVARHVELATLVPEGWTHVRPLALRGLALPRSRRLRQSATYDL